MIVDKVHEARMGVLKVLDEEAKSEEELAEAVQEVGGWFVCVCVCVCVQGEMMERRESGC